MKKKKHTNFLISFVFVFERRKTNEKPDEHEFYILIKSSLIISFNKKFPIPSFNKKFTYIK